MYTFCLFTLQSTPKRSKTSVSKVPQDSLLLLQIQTNTATPLILFSLIDDACSAYLSIIEPHPETSSALEELCFMVMGFPQKPQVSLEEKDNTKRFLFHYSKTHDSDNSDIMSSVLHPLLQLVPQLHERRLKRYKADVYFDRFQCGSRGSHVIRKNNKKSLWHLRD
uniref:Uncharacterized protein n=1 Tax=Gopherus agassizii TaxID=38772 RepID=A0A452IQ52_9SAUR